MNLLDLARAALAGRPADNRATVTSRPKQATELAKPITAPAGLTRTCAACVNVSRYGNCKRPVEAGLSERFEIIAAPAGHAAGCLALESGAVHPVAADPAETSGHWLIVQPAQRLECWYGSPLTRAELEKGYPGAALIALPEPASEKPRIPTGGEAAELRRLVDAVAAQEGFSEEERVEALEHALRDAPVALRCLRALLQGA